MSYVICDKETMQLFESPISFKMQWDARSGARSALRQAELKKKIYNRDNFIILTHEEYNKRKSLTL